jgi:DNA-binding transcriptional regulator YiaG
VPNLANTLRDEIRRLARKEVRQHVSGAARAVAQHRRDIAGMKRQIQRLEQTVAFLERREGERLKQKPPVERAEGARFSAKGLRAHRSRLGLSAKEYARLVGVSGLTIYNWESGKSRPRPQQLAALVAVRSLGKREAERRLAMLES